MGATSVAPAVAPAVVPLAFDLRSVVIGAIPILALLIWIFFDFFRRQWHLSSTYLDEWGHTFAIPFMAGYLVYIQRDKLLAQPFRTTWIAMVPIVAGLAWYTFATLGPPAIRNHTIQGIGLATTLFGLVLLFTGFRAMRYLWFPLFYLCLFGHSWTPRLLQYITYPLQDFTARAAHIGLNVIGIDTERLDNILTVWHNGQGFPLNIAEACSGMRMVVAMLALGVFMAFTSLAHLWQRLLLVALAVPVAVLVNILRVMTLGVMTLADPAFASGEAHMFIGTLWLIPALLTYFGVLWAIRKLVIDEPAATKR